MERISEEKLDERFNALKTLLAQWSKETLAIAKPITGRDDPEKRSRYLKLVRTIVSKWCVEILAILHEQKPLGFVELRKSLKGVSSRVLSGKLKLLEGRGLIARQILNTHPPRVQYALTERGLSLVNLGAPVILYMRFMEGLYWPYKTVRRDHRDPRNSLLSNRLLLTDVED